MASIDKATLAAYRQSLDRVCSEAGSAAMRALEEWLGSHPNASIEECREAAISIASSVLESYGDASSSLACNLFDSVMETEGVSVPAAQMYGGVREGAVEGTVRRVVGGIDGSQVSLDAFTRAVGQLIERETRLAASTTVEENVERVAKTKEGRNVRYARVPTSAAPCKWCTMLASRGFAYNSAETAGAASHHHCTCTIIPGVEGRTAVEGYDPIANYEKWQEFEQLDAFLATDSGKAYAKAAGLTSEEIRDAFARAKGGVISTRGSVESFIDSIRGTVGGLQPDSLHPARVAGVARTKESMSFAQADGLRANPGYGEDHKRDLNCQSCVVANEARRRGYDVAALPFSRANAAMDALAAEPYIAFQNSTTGELPRPIRYEGPGNPTLARFHAMVDSTVRDGERYALRLTTRNGSGHVVCLDRNDHGDLRVLDPQSGAVYEGRAVREYLKRVQYTTRSYGTTEACDNYIFRMDDAEFNPRVVDLVLEAAQ